MGEALNRTRRAELTFGLLVTTIIIAAVTLLTVILLTHFKYGIDDSMSDREQCRLSVLAHDALHYQVAGKDVTNPIDFDCKRRIVVIGKHHIEVNGKKKAFYDGLQDRMISSYDQLTPEIVNAVATDELAGCWYQFLQGKTDFLGEKTIDWGNNNRACAICSELQFDKDVSLPLPGKPEPLINYIKKAKVRKAYVLSQDVPRDAEKFIFNDDAICSAYYREWTDPSLGITDSVPCQEKYLSFWSKENHNKIGQFFKELLGLFANAKYGSLFLNPDVSIAPKTHTETYIILFMSEGGSFWHRKGLAAGNGLSTFAAWVIPASELNSDVCTAGYFT